jgi:hypothetical protein
MHHTTLFILFAIIPIAIVWLLRFTQEFRIPPGTTDGDVPDVVPELTSALHAYQSKRYIRAIALAEPHVEKFSDATRICALSYSAMTQFGDALPYWLSLFSKEQSAHHALQVATVSVMCGDLEEGRVWIQKANEINETTEELPPIRLRTSFISALQKAQHLSEALPHVTWLRDRYGDLHITDPTYLFMRGAPPFDVFLEKSLAILKATTTTESIDMWYAELEGRLDPEGEMILRQWRANLP